MSGLSVVPRSWAQAQTEFAQALLDPQRAMPAGLLGLDGAASPQRFAVYRNNVVVNLIRALEDAYPAVRSVVGAEFFRAAAGLHVLQAPPQSAVMTEYGAGFADFLADFEPVASLPYLPALARLERACVEAYHAAEAKPLAADDLLAMAGQEAEQTYLHWHPATRLVRSPYPIDRLWQMNTGQLAATPLNLQPQPQQLLITRPTAWVKVSPLPAGGAAFMQALQAGAGLAEASEAGAAASSLFDLSALLAQLLEAGACCRHAPIL